MKNEDRLFINKEKGVIYKVEEEIIKKEKKLIVYEND